MASDETGAGGAGGVAAAHGKRAGAGEAVRGGRVGERRGRGHRHRPAPGARRRVPPGGGSGGGGSGAGGAAEGGGGGHQEAHPAAGEDLRDQAQAAVGEGGGRSVPGARRGARGGGALAEGAGGDRRG